MDATQLEKIRSGHGFFAALDQSGGSTPGALAHYGIDADSYASDTEMFDLVQAMRARVISSPAFTGDRVLAAILFEQTMDRDVLGVPTAKYLWEHKQVVPFLKVDKGLADEHNDVQLMKPIDTLDGLLNRAVEHGIFGTKMRSVIKDANREGVAAIVAQQFEYAERIGAADLVPTIEPEVSINSPHKDEAEQLLRDELLAHLGTLRPDATVMFKLTIPTQRGLYRPLLSDTRVIGLLALSGGYTRQQACDLLAKEPVMIASFSRALLEGLTRDQTDEEFNEVLAASIDQIFRASVEKTSSP
jgi:fructose-bisphosphate aldolase class I